MSLQFIPPPQNRLLARFRPTLKYLGETEVHVFALSIGASVLLSFFPFLIVMVSLCKHVLHWPAAVSAIQVAITDFLPGEYGMFVWNNLSAKIPRHFQVISVFLLLFTANGIFEPLEVALNRAWGVTKNRSYLKNQAISLGLIFVCGSLAVLSAAFTAMNTTFLAAQLGQTPETLGWLPMAAFKLAAVPISIFILFLMYWILPNRKVRPLEVVPVAICVGLILELIKYINMLTWPLWFNKLQREYGPYVNSVTLILWTFVAAMVILAGANWSARWKEEHPTVEIPALRL